MNLQQRINKACEQLALPTMATEWSAISDHHASQEKTLADFLEQLLVVEIDAKTQRTKAMNLRMSGLPALKCLGDYDFNFASGAPCKQLQELNGLAFIERNENIVLLGPSGVGKSHLVIDEIGYLPFGRDEARMNAAWQLLETGCQVA